jgi:hypothetical protein
MSGDVTDRAFKHYLDRFTNQYGDKPHGSFVKFGRHLVQKLSRDDFADRFSRYLRLQDVCKRMLTEGTTISDAVVLDFEEACAWIALEAPNLYQMFRGELGNPMSSDPITDPEKPANVVEDLRSTAQLKKRPT